MIKRIIFDIDNTLIDFPNYEEGYQELLDKYHINKNAKELYDAIGVYEVCGNFKKYDKDSLLMVINDELNLNLDNKFIDDYGGFHMTATHKGPVWSAADINNWIDLLFNL